MTGSRRGTQSLQSNGVPRLHGPLRRWHAVHGLRPRPGRASGSAQLRKGREVPPARVCRCHSVYVEQCESLSAALKRERQLKPSDSRKEGSTDCQQPSIVKRVRRSMRCLVSAAVPNSPASPTPSRSAPPNSEPRAGRSSRHNPGSPNVNCTGLPSGPLTIVLATRHST